jgi:AcrR family transcriptional regulator
MAAQTARKKRGAPARRSTYHHGNLREALVEASLALVEEGGPERVTVREAARRAGVSSGAPFRHFPSRTALLTAVAEETMKRFRREIETTMATVEGKDPRTRLAALGAAYRRWALRNPTGFRVISDRSLIDFEGSEALRRDNAEIRALMQTILVEGQRSGEFRAADVTYLLLALRALSYGLARMYVDGHFPQWDVAAEDADSAITAVFDLFLAGIAGEKRPAKPRRRRRLDAEIDADEN